VKEHFRDEGNGAVFLSASTNGYRESLTAFLILSPSFCRFGRQLPKRRAAAAIFFPVSFLSSDAATARSPTAIFQLSMLGNRGPISGPLYKYCLITFAERRGQVKTGGKTNKEVTPFYCIELYSKADR